MASWRRLLAVISPRWRDPVACESCGGAFTCGASAAGCWCSKVEVSDAVRAQLRQRFDRCVCRTCLEHAQRTANETVPAARG